MKSCCIHLKAIQQELLNISIVDIIWKSLIADRRFNSRGWWVVRVWGEGGVYENMASTLGLADIRLHVLAESLMSISKSTKGLGLVGQVCVAKLSFVFISKLQYSGHFTILYITWYLYCSVLGMKL